MIPSLYPRSYRTPVSFRLWRLGLAIVFLYIIYVIAHLSPPAHHASERLWYALILLMLIGCVIASLRSFVVTKKVELTATSLTVTQMFSKTVRIQRKDIATCYVFQTRWMCVVIKHRNPRVAPIRLTFLNYDDAFWEWFSGIPGEREPSSQNWWSR
ncbi:hypothetical protein GCM10011408_16300 [Dyella caseinilytica]|nr:hypothetical protein GCM10011408_16300 [Dyella caseinilytica]